MKRFLNNIYSSKNLLRKRDSCQQLVYSIVKRCQSQWPKPDSAEKIKETKEPSKDSLQPKVDSAIHKYSSDDEELSDNKWRLELDWFTKALEPALQLCRWALPTGNGLGNRSPPSSRSVSEIIASIRKSRTGIQEWTLSDLTLGLYLLYLIYLRQSSLNPTEDVKGIQISSEPIVHDLIYHTELAKGSYKDSAASLARHSMLREKSVLKFVKDSSVMRPGYYIGIDNRKKLVILGIRGTHTVYDLITDIVSSSNGDVTYEGYSTHFGTSEAARWFLRHEMGTVKRCLEKHKGFRLRLVGHSLGGATASLLAIMLRRKSHKELGFDPGIVSAVGLGTPPCVSRGVAESCSSYVTTVVMQDDIIPRLSVATLTRLRNEILQTDWMSVIEREDWKNFINLVTNAKQVVSSVQDVARKLADYAKFRNKKDSTANRFNQKSPAVPRTSSLTASCGSVKFKEKAPASCMHEELYVPGTVYYLKRNMETTSSDGRSSVGEYFTLWKRNPGEHFQRIVLSSNIISDHRCDSHYHALRDVIKGLPGSIDEDLFR